MSKKEIYDLLTGPPIKYDANTSKFVQVQHRPEESYGNRKLGLSDSYKQRIEPRQHISATKQPLGSDTGVKKAGLRKPLYAENRHDVLANQYQASADQQQTAVKLTWQDIQWLWENHQISPADIESIPGLENFEMLQDGDDRAQKLRDIPHLHQKQSDQRHTRQSP